MKIQALQTIYHCPIYSSPFFLCYSNATNFFIHPNKQICLFFLKKNALALLVFFNRLPYLQISYMLPRLTVIGGKMSVASIHGTRGSGGVQIPLQGF